MGEGAVVEQMIGHGNTGLPTGHCPASDAFMAWQKFSQETPVFDIGFQRGYGCFEAMRSYGGIPFRLAGHLDRLAGRIDRARAMPLRPASLPAGEGFVFGDAAGSGPSGERLTANQTDTLAAAVSQPA